MVAMATMVASSHRLIIEIDRLCFLSGDILILFAQKCLLGSPPRLI